MAKKKRSSTKHRYAHWNAMKVLIVLGAILGIFLAIYYVIFGAFHRITTAGLPGLAWDIIWGIIHVLICIVLLASTGMINKPRYRVWCEWWLLLIFSLLLLVPTLNWGGLFVLIASIIGLIDRL